MEGPLSRKVMTASIEPKFQTVLEPHAALDLSTATPFISSVQSLAISSFSDALTLVYVGMTSGTLLLLSTNPKSESPMQGTPYIPSNTLLPQNFSLLRSVSISNFPVDWIYVIVDARTVLLLSVGSLFLVDMFLELPVKKLSFIKGVSVICRRFSTGDSETSNLLDYSENNSTSLRFFQKLGGGIREKGGVEAQCDGSCIFALISGKRLFLAELILSKRIGRNNEDIKGSDGSFFILKEFPCVEGVRTMVWVDDSIVVGTSGGYTLISCTTGQNGLIFTLPDHSSPQQLLSGKECNVLLMLDNVGVTIDANGQPIGGSLVFRQAPDSLGEISPYLIVVRDGKLELYDKKIGSCIQIVNFAAEGVGNCIVAHDEGGCGKFVAVATPSKIICYRKIPCEEQIKDLLRKNNFMEALALVEELVSEGELTKEMLSFVHAQVGFLLFFDMHFEEAVNHFLQSETMQPSEIFPFILQDPNRWSLQVQRNRYWGMHPPPAPLEDVIDEALLAIQRAIFLKKAGVETDMDEYFILNPPSRTDMLELALKNIIRYLEVSRQKDLILSVREGVDTLLMYLYRALNRVGDMEKLASSENHCVVEEIETLLDESGHLRTLAFLYARKGMSSKALNIWCVLARNYAGFQEDLGEESASIMSGKEIAASRAAEILEESCNQDLILQHLGWISDINQMLAVKILTSEKRVNQLSADEVITAIDTKKVEILQRYLQWLVEVQDSNDPRFHTLYALSLAQSALETFQHDHASHCLDVGSLACKNLSDMKRNSFFQNTVRMRLQNFLQSSDLYDFEEVLDLIEGSELWLEKAILYKKLGQETIVLFILALKLEDSDAAEQYCAEIGRPDAYMQLLDMYLAPQDGKEPMFKAAVRLLHNHGELLDPLQVLETLSLDMPLQLASDTILRMFRARIHHHRQGQVMLNLSYALDIDARLARMEERSRYVQINDENLCDSCHARLGTKLFAMYPDDTIVCYKCFRRQGESTSVRGRNFRQDALIKPAWLVIR